MDAHFFSYKLEGEELDSPYQLTRMNPTAIFLKYKDLPFEKQLEMFHDKINADAEHYFLWVICETTPANLFGFLDYHYKMYREKNPGGELNFLFFIDEQTDGVKGLEAVPIPKVLSYDSDGNEVINPDYVAGAERREITKLSEKRRALIKEWVTNKKKELNPSLSLTQGTGKPTDKIKWAGSPSQFGYIILELVKHGFIEPPLYHGETNFTGLAKLCFNNFNIDTSQENLIKEMNQAKNTLSDTKRAKIKISDTEFNIPDLSDLA